ncbi:polyketide synthase [Pseudomonas oryzihabitans]|nr:polyketide synthase [Pseudomonas psychrotolerans]KTT39983.1 polyketide synthase [Pseudomonas psychrotolerans]KTT43838.1 polyketide synthase [Pseudomonas psychrotolerans]KTT64573.1 polyketide synthase [Pseudomonas psychrotolerans]
MTATRNIDSERLTEALRASLQANEALKRQNRELQADAQEPIAIVAMGCRLPGGLDSPEALWRLVEAGAAVSSALPSDRGWQLNSLFPAGSPLRERIASWRGGFLDDVAGFDAPFFRISDREAQAMDPQQRLLLEISWEVLERAGIVPATLKNSATGVFLGATQNGYLADLERRNPAADGYRLQGGLSSIVSGRIAFVLGLRGPAVTVDTACSASLTAIHLAVQALRGRDCSLALAGGVTVMATPEVFAEFTRQNGLAADGYCKAFAEQADGTCFAEGAGVLLLERLSDAQRAGHPVLAVIRGSALNQDGASNGLTAPSGPAQEQVIQLALQNARLRPLDIDVVEAHGTGTALGDPIEAGALINTYGRGRTPERPLWLGSLKSNIGHTQLAAGVASVIKMVMALNRGLLPKTLHAQEPSSKIDWSERTVRLLDTARPWPETGMPRRAGVSSFGFSGTNAHLILEQAPPVEQEARHATVAELDGLPPVTLPLSAACAEGLRAQARQTIALLEDPATDLAALNASLALQRSAFDHRAVILAAQRADGLVQLQALAEGRYVPGLIQGQRSPSGTTAFLFSGQGAQWPGMGRHLYRLCPPFAAALDEVCAALDPLLPQPLKDVLFADRDSDRAALLDRTDFTQPALFAFEVALYRMLHHFGIYPDILLGHSIGEIAAAQVAGVFTLADAARFVTTRGRLMQAIAPEGAMVAIEASEQEVRATLAGLDQSVAIAAVNAPTAVVISGDRSAVERLAADWQRRGQRTQALRVSHAFHSPHLDAILPELHQTLAGLSFHAPSLPIVSTVTGMPLTAEQARSPDYWAQQARQPVRFAAALHWLLDHRLTTAVEIGPDAVLTALGRTNASHHPAGEAAQWIAPQRRDKEDPRPLFAALAQLYTQGAALDWRRLLPPAPGMALPTYPFQHRHYWLQPRSGATDHAGNLPGLLALEHPLLSHGLERADGQGWVFWGQLDGARQPWLLEHRVGGQAYGAGAMTAECILTIGNRLGCPRLEDLTLQRLVPLPDQGAVDIQIKLDAPTAQGVRDVAAYYRPAEQDAPGGWQHFASCQLLPDLAEPPLWPDLQTAAWPPAHAEPLAFADLYARLAEQGVELEGSFRRIVRAWQSPEGIYVEAERADSEPGPAFTLHPTLLDAGLHSGLLVEGAAPPAAAPRLLFSMSGMRLYQGGATQLRGLLQLKAQQTSPTAPHDYRMRLADYQGRAVVTLDSMVLKSASTSAMPRRLVGYRLQWSEVPHAPAATLPEPLWLATRDDLPSDCTSTAYLHLADAITALAATPPGTALILVPSIPQATVAEANRALLALAATLREWLEDARTARHPLLVATRRAVATAADEDVPNLSQAAFWGLLRTAQAEHPDRLLLLDLDAAPATTLDFDRALAVALAGEPQLAWRQGRLLAPRLVRSSAVEPASEQRANVPLDPEGTVLITGGTGTLGRALARHLVAQHGARHLLLVSRRGAAAPGATALVEELAEQGAATTVATCDVADPQALAQLLDGLPARQPLTAVFHVAGVVEPANLLHLSPAQLAAVVRPKLDAAWQLHLQTRQRNLAAFVLYSSAAGLLPQPGQSHYAAANTFLDALAHHRRHLGLPAVALAWGLWAERSAMGERLAAEGIQKLLDRGQLPIALEDGLSQVDLALTGALPPLSIPARLDLQALRRHGPQALLRELLAERPAQQASLRPEALAELAPAERRTRLLALIAQGISEVLGHPDPAAIPADTEFLALGFDSLTAVEMGSRLAATTGVRLPSTAVFDHPTLSALADHLSACLDQPARSPASTTAAVGVIFEQLREALRQGHLAQRLEQLAHAAARGPTFTPDAAQGQAPAPSWSRQEPDRPLLIGLNSFLPARANLTYQRLSRELEGRYGLATLPLPGYGNGPLPASAEAAAEALAHAVEACAAGRAFTLLGFSTGGLVAYAVAERLQQRGLHPAALCLIDTYPPAAMHSAVLEEVLREWLESRSDFWSTEDDGLSAMAYYLELFGRWNPLPLETPVLLLQAEQASTAGASDTWPHLWPRLTQAVKTPGRHFALLSDEVQHTAQRLIQVLADYRGAAS